MKLVFGCDPNAEDLKQLLMEHARKLGHEVADLGSEDPIYANVAFKLGEAVATGEYERGVLLCGTGIGVSIAANKVKGVFCALLNNVYQAQRAQLSNNANVIAIGAQVTGPELAKVLLETYLANTFDENSRSAPKVARIAEYES
ncbi:MAG: RpiB/LacA/LacB family sugar-phosphate isomerase [Anaerolineaceae bacterium]|jgi:ribose 5-phosphate isomerase B